MPSTPSPGDRPLTIPDSLNPTHAALLRELHFETAGTIRWLRGSDTYDGLRVIYAITNPTQTEIIYIGDAEVSRDVRGRVSSHMKDRGKINIVELESLIFVHVMITEYRVLDRFEQETGKLPIGNKRKTAKHVNKRRPTRINDKEARLEWERELRARGSSPAEEEAKKRGYYDPVRKVVVFPVTPDQLADLQGSRAEARGSRVDAEGEVERGESLSEIVERSLSKLRDDSAEPKSDPENPSTRAPGKKRP